MIPSLYRIRESSPLILNITNYVAMTPSANALLAVGASPLMSSCAAEMEELVRSADAVVVNIGCIDEHQFEAMSLAVDSAASIGKPWIFDPAGVAASRYRLESALLLVGRYAPAVIRGNAAEINALARGTLEDGQARGVSSVIGTDEARESADRLASAIGSIVCVSGPVDYITDGNRSCRVGGGSPMMSKVTAMGCISSALVAAFRAVCPDSFEACRAAMELMSETGAEAAGKSSGSASFAIAFIDELSVR